MPQQQQQLSAPADVLPQAETQPDAAAQTQPVTFVSPAPGTAPLHIHGAMAWYQGELLNMDISATWMAQHYDITEQGDNGSSFATAFMAAGGKFAMLYSDPEIIPFCSSPFSTLNGAKPGACTGPMAPGLNGTEAAWLHDASGNRLHVTAYGTQAQGFWQDRNNPTYSGLPTVYRNWVNSIITGSSTNALEIDDIQSGYDPSYFKFKFGATSREFDALGTNANPTWLAGQQRIIAAAPKPVFINGTTPYAESTIMTSRNVLGHMFESCASTTNTTGIIGSTWIANMNSLLRTTALKRYAICVNYAAPTSTGVPERIYGLASWWLTYDPTWSVNLVDIQTADKHEVYPEHGIALYNPLKTATLSNITTLRTTTGVYLREFAFCYVNKVAIGPCAAEVNPDTVGHTAPVTHYAYKHYLSLNNKSWFSGGAVGWTSGVYTTVAARSAHILKL